MANPILLKAAFLNHRVFLNHRLILDLTSISPLPNWSLHHKSFFARATSSELPTQYLSKKQSGQTIPLLSLFPIPSVKNHSSLYRQPGCFTGLPWWLAVKNPPASVGDEGLISGLGRSPGERNGSPLQYSCLGNPMDYRA